MPGFLPARKVQLRQQLLKARQLMLQPERERAERVIADVLSAQEVTQNWRAVAVFLPWRGEPDLMATWRAWHARGVRLALPVVVAHETPLVMQAWRPGEPLIHDVMGMSVPMRSDAMDCDTWLIPCVGVDQNGARLGAGKGFYDRTLASITPPYPRLVGICFELARCKETFGEDHDLRLDACVTETGWHAYSPHLL